MYRIETGADARKTSTCCSTFATTSRPAWPGRPSRPPSACSAVHPSSIAFGHHDVPRRVPRPHVKDGGCPLTDVAIPTPTGRRRRRGGRVSLTIDGREFDAKPGELAHRRGRAGRHLHPAVLLPPAHGAGGHVPHVPGRGDGPRGATLQPACFIEPWPTAWWSTPPRTRSRRPRTACSSSCWPTTRSTARLRQGRRVPAAGPDAGLRPGRDPVRRGEAPLREAHRHSELVLLDRERCIQCAAAPASRARWPARPRSTSRAAATR
jgi:hypothetical protein